MKIRAQAEVAIELYEKYNEVLKCELRNNVCKELMKYDVFIEPPIRTGRNGRTTMQMYLFVLSYSDVDELQEFAEKYPEMDPILQNIIVKI